MEKIFIIGAGNRAYELLIKPLQVEKYDKTRIIGIYDINIQRAMVLSSYMPYSVPIYDDLEEVMKKVEVDIFIIMTPDYTHVPIIKKILDYSNALIVCEKPLCVLREQIIYLFNLPIEQKSRIKVLFNSRFMPVNLLIKELLDKELVGKPLSINYNWNIDLKHGVEYLRRWHSDINKSGGMLVHKSCHHFDLLNWWLDDVPQKVFAFASKSFFSRNQKNEENCRQCRNKCAFAFNLEKQPLINEMYFRTEKQDGYIRDKCIFKNVSIYDTMCSQIIYKNNTMVSYMLNMYAPKTSWNLNIIGTNGSISVNYVLGKKENKIGIQLLSGEEMEISVAGNGGKHEGADLEIRKILFENNAFDENEINIGSLQDGITASIIGIASNMSIKERKSYEIREIIDL